MSCWLKKMFCERATLYNGRMNVIVKATEIDNSGCTEKGRDKNSSPKRCYKLTMSEIGQRL